jgi:hypothetical protein
MKSHDDDDKDGKKKEAGFPCRFCGKILNHKDTLIAHEYKHTGL